MTRKDAETLAIEKRFGKTDARPRRKGWAPGNYVGGKCTDCKCSFIGDKRAALCADCAYKDWKPTHREGSTGDLYRFVSVGVMFGTNDRIVILEDASGLLVVLKSEKFFGGGFATGGFATVAK